MASLFAVAIEKLPAATLVQEFYLPMPEQQIYQANNAIISGTGSTIASTFSIVATGNGTVIYYDQWEDGYETDLGNPTQSTTQIWGDGNDANGIPPGFAHDPAGLPAGTVITLTNNVALPRNPSTILWDARDRIAATKALVITRAAWPIPTGPVFAGAAGVLSTMDYGTNYISPVGQDLTPNLFKYVGMFIMAAQNNTAVTIDPNGNGVGTTNIVLNQGESYLINGGIKKGGRVTASKPIQADLLIGHVGSSYASDWFTLYPVSAWDNTYYTPVSSASSGTQPAYVYLYNPGSNAITINYATRAGGGSFAIPGTNGVYQFQMPIGSGASFVSAGGQKFFAICTVAANNSSDTAYNWGFTLVPKAALTTEGTVGWGPGSSDGTVNGSPVWVTTLGNTTVYVDYKGDHAGPLTDPNGNKYDTNFTVVNLQSLKIYDPSKDQTGMRVYTVDGTLLTAAWGEDADKASPGNPYIDAGTTVLPFPVPVLHKSAIVVTDTPPTGLSIGDTIQYTVQIDNKGLLPLGNTVVIDAPSTNLTYVANSSTWNGSAIPDSATGTPFPLDAPGFTIPIILSQGTSTFTYLYTVNAAGTISNSVNIGGTPITTEAILAPPSTNGTSVNIRFTDTSGISAASYAAGANVFVTLTNATGNTSPTTTQTIYVTVTDTNTGDAETILLTETGVNTGVFRNTTGLQTSATAGLVNQDGVLHVAPGDTLSVSYTEPYYGSSSSSTALIQIPSLSKQLYLSVNGLTNGVQALNRIDPVAYGHSPTRTSVDIGSGGGTGAVLFDAETSNNSSSASTLTVNHTTGASANRIMLVSVAVGSSSATGNDVTTVTGVTNGSTALTLVGVTNDPGTRVRCYIYSQLNPPSGSSTVTIRLAAARPVFASVATFSGVDQSTPLGTLAKSAVGNAGAGNGGATSASLTVASAPGELVYSTLAVDSDGTTYSLTPSAGQTELAVGTNFSTAVYTSTTTGPGAASVNETWNWSPSDQQQYGALGISIKPAAGGGPGGPATNVTAFVQTPNFALPFTIPAGSAITITNFIALTNGSFGLNPAVTASLQANGTNFLTLASPIYNAASNTLVWNGVLSSNLTIPAGATIGYTISNGASGTAFHVNYDSTTAPSKITLPTTTVIAINAFGIYDAPYPGGSLVTTPVAGTTLYVRANVADPFGAYDITSLGLAFTAPDTNNNFSAALNDASVVASDAASKTYEYVWNTGPATGNYTVAATAHEGTEGITAVASAGISTIFLDLGTPSTTEFTSGNNGSTTNAYLANSTVCVRVSDLNRNTNATTVESIAATVSSSSGDSEVLALTETGTNTGIFTSCINTSTNGANVPGDGTLFAPVGSVLTASYTDDTDPSDSTSATATIQPLPGVPGVAINKTIISPAGGQVGVGQPVTYNLQVVNVGSTTLPSMKVTDAFTSSKLSYASASVAPDSVTAGTLTWNNLGAFTPGQSTNITVTFTTLATGTATNSAAANGSTATNTSSVTIAVNSAAVNVVKVLLSPTNQPVSIQSNVVFRITVQNVGNTTINYLPLEDTFSSAYYQYVSATISPDGTGAGSLIWTNLAYPVALATNTTITNDITMKVVGQGSPANNVATVDFATDIYGNPVPATSGSVGVTTSAAGISGYVYNDINQSGVYTNGDAGLANVTLKLYTDPNGDGDPADGTIAQVTTTDANGYYEFLNLTVGHYVVVETDLAGYSSSAPVNNRLPLNLTSLVTVTNNNFFDYIPAPSVYSTFSGTVYNDVLGTGINTSQAGLNNVTIDLVQDVNSNGIADLGEPVASSAATDANGNYSISGVTPGHYVLRESVPYGYYRTGDSQPPNDGQIALVTTNGVVVTNNSFFARQSPTAVNDTNSTSYFVPVTINPLVNDLSPNGDTLTISNSTSAFGTVIINPGATSLTFTPTNVGVVTISYTMMDEHGGSSLATITVNVSPAPLTITANSTNKIYGQTVTFAGTEFTATGLTNGDTVTSVTLNSAGAVNTANVGSYAIIPSAAIGSGLANYSITYATNGSLTVSPAILGVTANSTNRLYNTPNPTFTYTPSGFVNGDTASVLSGAPSLTTAAILSSPAGTYPIVATNGTLIATNYVFSFTNGVLTVNLAAPVVTWPKPTDIVYGTPLSALENNATSSVPGTAVYNPTNGTVLDVGTNTLTVLYTPTDTNYATTNLSVQLVVTPAPLSVTASNVARIYGQPNPTFGGAITGIQNSDNITATYATAATAGSPVGGYLIVPTLIDPNGRLANYSVATNNGTLTVSPAILGITANNTNRLYNTANPTFTYTPSGFVNGDNAGVLSGAPSLTTSATLSSPAGTYPIVATNGTLNATNYVFTFTNGTLTVLGGNYGITWTNPASIVYGTLLGADQNNANATVAGSYVYNPTNGALLSAGTNSLHVTFTPTDTNYTSTNLSVTLVVTPAPLTITADSTNKVYNTTLVLDTTAFTSSGLMNSETIGGVTLSSAGTVANAAVGIYPITASSATGGTFNPANYSITYSNGILTVLAASYVITWPTPTNIVYGTALGTNENAATSTIPGTFDYNPTNGVILPAGTNLLTVHFTPTDTNYAATNLSVQLVVDPASLSIVANDQTKLYGQTLTLGAGQTTFSSSGLVNGDSVTSVTLASTGASSGAAVGTYPIVPSAAVGSGLTNYNIGYSNGTLTVSASGYTVNWPTPANIVYGTPLSSTQNNASSSVPGTAVYNPTDGTVLPAGTNLLSVIYTPTDTNYAATNLSVLLVVTPAPLSVTASNVARVYGQPNPVLGGTISGIQNSDNITATYTSAATTNSPVGNYLIVPALSDPNSRLANYVVTTNNGTLTVSKAVLAITASSTNRLYGAANPVFTYTASGFVNADNASVLSGTPSLTTAATTNSGVGPYAIVATNGTLSATNYAFSFTDGTLTIGKAALIVTADNTNRLYGAANPAFTASYSGFVNGESASVLAGSPSLTSAATTVSGVGSYPIVATNGTLSAANYAFSFASGTLTIGQASLTVTANDQSKSYGTTLTLGAGQTAFTSSGLLNSDSVTSVTLSSAGATSGAAVGSYPIVPSAAIGSGLTNYSIVYSNGALTVNFSTPIVTWPTPTSIVYGTALSSLQNNATSSVSGTAVYNPTNGTVLTAGTNTLTVVYTPTDTNFAATNLSVYLVVTPAPLSVTASNVTRLYGQPNPAFGGTISGIQNSDNITATYASSATTNSPVGNYPIVPTLSDPNSRLANYAVTTNNGNLTVNAATLGITANDTNRLYGAMNPVFTYTASGFVNGENASVLSGAPSLTTTATTNSLVGMYPIVAAAGTLSAANYVFSFTNGTLTVSNSGPSADVIVLLTGPASVIQGSNVVYQLVITNAGPNTSSNLVVSDSLPTNLVFIAASGSGKATNSLITWPTIKALPAGGTTNYTLTVNAPNAGAFTNIASALAATFDPNPNNNNGISPASQAQIIVAPAQLSAIAGTPVVNPQTGLFEETVTVTNNGSVTVLGFRLHVAGLTNGVTLYNATGTTNGVPYVDYLFPLDPSNSVSLILEFYDPTRKPFTSTLVVEPILPGDINLSSTNRSVAVSRVFTDTRNDGLRFVIEFASVPGTTYSVLYSTNLNAPNWKVATPSVTANANITQWYDDGPPKTESKPASVSARYYRIIKF